jgi:hypothetical protein
MGQGEWLQHFDPELEPVFETDRNLGFPDRVRLRWRQWGDPLPIGLPAP